jgi:cell division protein FtsL
MEQMQACCLSQSTLSISSIMPPLADQVIIDQEEDEDDKGPTQGRQRWLLYFKFQYISFWNIVLLDEAIIREKYTTSIGDNSIDDNHKRLTTDSSKSLLSKLRPTQLLHVLLKTSIHVMLAFLLLIVTLGILTSILVVCVKQNKTLKNEVLMKDELISKEQTENNQLKEQIEKNQLIEQIEKNRLIEQLNSRTGKRKERQVKHIILFKIVV